jgi:hypothetical protein
MTKYRKTKKPVRYCSTGAVLPIGSEYRSTGECVGTEYRPVPAQDRVPEADTRGLKTGVGIARTACSRVPSKLSPNAARTRERRWLIGASVGYLRDQPLTRKFRNPFEVSHNSITALLTGSVRP